MHVETEIPVEARIRQVLQHLGIEKAHFALRNLGDLTGLAAGHPELFASLTLVCPAPPQRELVAPLASRLLVYRGDTAAWDGLGQLVADLPGAALQTLQGWEPWSDLVTKHENEIAAAMFPFLAANTSVDARPIDADGEQGVVAGISYHIQGAGPPLLLFPLGFVPSQWDALMPRLTQEYATITLGGAELGVTALLEKRATSEGYLGMVRTVVQEARLHPGEAVLEVGCGTGALSRWLARYTEGRNAITGVDINRYFLREAANLARTEGLAGMLQFEEGNGEALPFPDHAFDLTLSVTVLEEVDADKMLAEMIRVTKPGGRVAAVVRAMDMPFFVNLPLDGSLKAKAEDPAPKSGAAGERGCADASLYRRFQETDLIAVKMFPHLAAFVRPWALEYLQAAVMPTLDETETIEWQAARAQAEAEGTFFFSFPHHCAVGTKPAQNQ